MRQALVMNHLLAAFFVFGLSIGALSAEDEVPDAEAQQKELTDRIKNALLEEYRLTAQAHLTLQIEDMQVVCELSESDVKKLGIAAKGAADQFTKKYRKQISDNVKFRPEWQQMPIWVGGKQVHVPQNKDQIEGLKEGLKRLVGAQREDPYVRISINIEMHGMQYRVRQRNSSSSRGNGSAGLDQLRKQPVWKKMVERVVTPEKRKLYETSLANRSNRLREAAIALQMSRFSAELKLSEPQQTAITALFEKQVDISNSNFNMVEYHVRSGFKKLEDAKMKELLSESQFQLWHGFKNY